ncbi:NnrU family protein [Paremcibacter congregatus]|uniref:NnrU family protein n=1 Tax=Paremcibacter congregatus TaxID=2043170 RepID=UPI003A8EBD95
MMLILFAGALFFGLLHLIPAALPKQRQKVAGQLGENIYKGIFSIGVLLSILLIVLGWRSTETAFVYSPPEWGYLATVILMYPALYLLVAARVPCRIRRLIRHPQLTGVFLWALAHLLANGDSRSLTLFGILALWAPLEMILLNRRDGIRAKPATATLGTDIKVGVIAAVLYIALAYGHVYFTGIALSYS